MTNKKRGKPRNLKKPKNQKKVISLDTSQILGLLGALVGVIAMLFLRTISKEMESIRDMLNGYKTQVKGTDDALRRTREDYVTAHEFNGAINRVIEKIEKMDNYRDKFVDKTDCREKMADQELRFNRRNNG